MKQNTRVDVRCPSCPWEGTTMPYAEAPYLALSLSEDHGYAFIMDRERGTIIAEYTDGRAT